MITTVIKYFKLKLCTLMASSTLDLGRYTVRATAALCAAMEGDCGERADIEKGGEGGREGKYIVACSCSRHLQRQLTNDGFRFHV